MQYLEQQNIIENTGNQWLVFLRENKPFRIKRESRQFDKTIFSI